MTAPFKTGTPLPLRRPPLEATEPGYSVVPMPSARAMTNLWSAIIRDPQPKEDRKP